MHDRFNRSMAKGPSFCHPRPPNSLDQMLTTWRARCVGHCEMTWSAVCSLAPHSQFGNGARPHLRFDEQKRPTLERRWLSLIQDALDKPIDLVLTLGMKALIDDRLLRWSGWQMLSWSQTITLLVMFSSTDRNQICPSGIPYINTNVQGGHR